MPFLASFLPGYGTVAVASLAATGAITGASLATTGAVTASGDVQGAIVRGTTALEFPAASGSPGVRCTSDTDVGVGREATNTLSMFGGGAYAKVGVFQLTGVGITEIVSTGRFESRAERRISKRTVDISAVGSTVAVAGAQQVELTLSAGPIVSTAAPFMADGADGDEIDLMNVDTADALVLADDGATASNLRLRDATRTLAANGGHLKIRFSAATGFWQETGFG